MSILASSAPEAPAPLRSALGRAAAGTALLAGAALWLWVLPVLLMRDGFVMPIGASCAQAGYRDPVTGRQALAPSARLARPESCRPAAGTRP
jgi:hypothetical protein